MDCHISEQNQQPKPLSPAKRIAGLAMWVFSRVFRPSHLDLDGMPDRVKRDLGFMDGRDPRYELELWR